MPFANEHAARQSEPDQYERFARMHPEGFPEGMDAIMGIKGDASEIQSIRADKSKWTVDDFKTWLEEHDFESTVEPASEEETARAKRSKRWFILSEIGPEPVREFRILAAGRNETTNGLLRLSDADAVVAADSAGMQLPIDYEHGMLAERGAYDTGTAAGWFHLEARDGELWAVDVEWTPRAAAALSNREYRYISPAVEMDDQRHVLRVINVALTNLPAMRPATAVAAKEGTNQETGRMATKLHELLGAKDEAEAIVIASEFDRWTKGVLAETEAKSLDAARARIVTLKAQAAEGAKLAVRVAELEGEKLEREKAVAIVTLSEAGKAPPAVHGFLRTLTLEQLKTYGECAPMIAPTASAAPVAVITLTEEDRKFMRMTGVSHDAFVAARKNEQRSE